MAKSAKSAFNADDAALLAALGVEDTQEPPPDRTPEEERVIAGFEEIRHFVARHGRLPSPADDRDIFERLCATRLEHLRDTPEWRDLLVPLDGDGLLAGAGAGAGEASGDADTTDTAGMSDDELLAALGVDDPGEGHITRLEHIRPRAEIRPAEEVAERTQCKDFAAFKPVFDAVQAELGNGVRRTKPFRDDARIRQGDLFILSGQKVYVAAKGPDFHSAAQKRKDARIRAIYDNGTESDLLMTSLQRALQKDRSGRRITDPSAGPLFSGDRAADDLASGRIYVLRSKSDDPRISRHRDILHKIGVTGGSIEKRIANAAHDPTFLLAEVEIAATYELVNINRQKLEGVIHGVFDAARLDIEITDRFGHPVLPREWFLVPLFVINDAVARIRDASIAGWYYDPQAAALRRRD